MKLTDAIGIFVQHRRSRGALFIRQERNLRRLSQYCGDIELRSISPHLIAAYLAGSSITNAGHRRLHSVIRMFLNYWIVRGEINFFAMPERIPDDHVAMSPYVFSKDELRRLLRAVDVPGIRLHSISRQTLRAVLLTLYATGANVSEVLLMRNRDADLRRASLNLAGNSRVHPRRIPICKDLLRILGQHAESCARRRGNDYFFPVIDTGKPIVASSLYGTFRRLCRKAGIKRAATTRTPCIRDLRATFAVHRLNSWIRGKADMNRMVPALAAYMGLEFYSIERYLRLAPERFRRTILKVSSARPRKRWRDDSALIQFLRGL